MAAILSRPKCVNTNSDRILRYLLSSVYSLCTVHLLIQLPMQTIPSYYICITGGLCVSNGGC